VRKYSSLLVTSLFLVLVLPLISIPLVSATEGSWEPKASMNKARAYLGVAAVNGKIYAIGGENGHVITYGSTALQLTPHVVNTTEMYDPICDTWTLKAPMPTPRGGFGVAVYQNKIYCIGGWTHSGSYNNTGANEIYDPTTNTWETKSTMPNITTNLYTANVVNDKIYVIGIGKFIAEYDPLTDSWTTKTPPPDDVMCTVSFVIDDKIYTIRWPGDFFQIYDPATDSWNLGTPFQFTDLTLIGGSLTAAETTGTNASKRIYFFDLNQTKIYDSLTGNWTDGTAMPTKRLLPKAIAIDDTIYLIGGRTGTMSLIAELNPSALNEQYTSIEVIPEFPSSSILLLLLSATLFIIFCKKKLLKTANQQTYL
jgi:N-acetylneuraminic acid mutarotase